MSNLSFSIVIPTYNRKNELKECLESIAALETDSELLEIIIVDDGSTDGTDTFITQLKSSFPFSLVYEKQANAGPSAARNRGLHLARAEYVIFLDSDVIVPSDFIKKIQTALKDNPVDVFGGPDEASDDFPPLFKAINYAMTGMLTTGGLRGKKGKKLAKYYPRTFNMGVRKEFALKIGGFNENMRTAEDIEFSYRAYKNGGKVAFIDAPVYHKRRSTLLSFLKQVFRFGRARITLAEIDPSLLEPLHALPAVATLFTACTLCSFLFIPATRPFSSIILLLIVSYFILISLTGIIRYKSLKVGLYLLLVAPIQIFGYGSGFIFQFINRLYTNRKAGQKGSNG